MKLHIQADLDPRCVAFLRQKLDQFDMNNLEYIRLYDRTAAGTRLNSSQGEPNRS